MADMARQEFFDTQMKMVADLKEVDCILGFIYTAGYIV